MNPNEYQCAMCGGVFEKARSDEEAIAEKEVHFEGVPIEACAVICDDCYQNVRPDTHTKEYTAYQQQHAKGHKFGQSKYL